MATPQPETDPQQQALTHKAAQAAVVAGTAAAVGNAFDLLGPNATSLTKVSAALHAFVDQHGRASAQLARSNYLRRRASAGLVRPPRLHVAPPAPLTQAAANVDRLAADMLAKLDQSPDIAAIQANVEAAIQRLILESGRESTIGFVAEDKGALGFMRVPHPGACAFCLMCAIRRDKNTGRPGVYKSRSSAGQIPATESGSINRFHDGCECTVEAVFSADQKLAPFLEPIERLYFDSTRNSKSGDQLNDFRRALAAQRAGEPIPELPTPTVIRPQVSPADALAALLAKLPAPKAA